MKFTLAALLTLALSAVALPAPDASVKAHEGTKVIRVSIPDSAESASRLEALVNKLDLSLWSRNFSPNGNVDIQIPKEKLKDFEAASIEWKKTVMHEDLGASIKLEAESMVPDDGEMRIQGELYPWPMRYNQSMLLV